MKTIGIILAIAGVIALVYGGIDYTRDKTVLDVGPLNITATEHKTFPIPAIVGVVVLIGGVALLMGGSRRSRVL
ncbi:MAG: DUF3185 domain-containing protein [bacterium]|nr:DUF3185 domain-containing protein [bacterium]